MGLRRGENKNKNKKSQKPTKIKKEGVKKRTR
jgi:hypothetical protein